MDDRGAFFPIVNKCNKTPQKPSRTMLHQSISIIKVSEKHKKCIKESCMGISSNQARFLTLTSRQIDLEYRVQQICQRRLRLASELERVASEYNNKISNRSMYTFNTTNAGISELSVSKINAIKDSNGNAYQLVFNNGTNYVQLSGQALDSITVDGVSGGLTAENLGLDSDASDSQIIEAAIRQGLLSIATVEDVYTQEAETVKKADGSTLGSYEIRDWRTLSQIADELYKGDNAEAETTYEKVTAEINAQDKKLQLEQTAIEIEYKAVTTEKDAVKKILDQNAQASFKYFS